MSYPDHPDLWGRYNDEAVNADELNGGGNNWPVSPVEYDSFVALNPFIRSRDMLAVFDGCPDFVVRGENDTYVVRCEPRTLTVRRAG